MGDLHYHTDSRGMDCPCFCEDRNNVQKKFVNLSGEQFEYLTGLKVVKKEKFSQYCDICKCNFLHERLFKTPICDQCDARYSGS